MGFILPGHVAVSIVYKIRDKSLLQNDKLHHHHHHHVPEGLGAFPLP